MLACLLALGGWQLRRKVWKEALLTRIASLQTAPAEPLSVVLNRVSAAPPHGQARRNAPSVDFVRVQARCERIALGRGVHLYGFQAAGPGWRQVAACALPPGLPYRSLLVDLGFERLPPSSPPALQPLALPASGAALTGVLRVPDPPAWTDRLAAPPSSGPDTGQWLRRDVDAMARALNAPDPAPFMLELEEPAAGPGLIPSPLPTDIPNRHLEYAVTWFGLAAALAGLYGGWLWRRLRGA